MTGTDLLAYAERCRMNSSDAGVDIDKTSIQAASVVLHISLPATLDSLICSQVRHSGRSCTIFHALPQWIISLHVFEDDTVAKVTVSKANLNVFFVLLGPAPFFVASLFCFEAKRKSGWGNCGSFLVVVVLLFFVCRWFRDDLPKFLDHTCPCTFLLFTAYAIVRTEPSANRPNRRKKKSARLAVCWIVVQYLPVMKCPKRRKPYCFLIIQPKKPARYRKNSMHRYHHALMTSTISHTMKTACKSTSAVVFTATAIVMLTLPFRFMAMHMDYPCEYDDWKSATERTLSVP